LYQYFSGEEFFRHTLPGRSSITRWRNRMGEERLEGQLQTNQKQEPGDAT
jgi:IS5 family transposase